MAASEAPGWLGEHLFFRAPLYTPECDRILLDVVRPFVERCREEGWIDAFFFVRYGDGGSHVRLRLHGVPAVLEETVRPALRAHLARVAPGVREGWPDGSGEPGALTHVARVPYEPETERYGGPDGVALAEAFFQASSEATFALLQTMGSDRSSRLGKALLAMALLTHAFVPVRAHAAVFARAYGMGYLRSLTPDDEARSEWLGAFGSGYERQAAQLCAHVDEVWERLEGGEPLSPTLDRYRAHLDGLRRRFDALCAEGRLLRAGVPFPSVAEAVDAIVPSYVHMTGNRLGVSIPEESYLAYLVARALGAPAPEPSASGAEGGR
jgi:thiopeptide-type bacteriocin biosynthesis protein